MQGNFRKPILVTARKGKANRVNSRQGISRQDKFKLVNSREQKAKQSKARQFQARQFEARQSHAKKGKEMQGNSR